jgi:hypothetical protein
VVDKARDATFRGINDHILVERHQVVTLCTSVSGIQHGEPVRTYLVILIVFIHSAIALIFCDDFTGVLNNYLVRIKASIAPYPVTTVSSFDDFDPDSVFVATFATFL